MKKYFTHCIYETLRYKVVPFSQGKQIFLEDSDLTCVYHIRDGLVKMNRIHPSGDEKIFDILGSNDYIALLAVLQDNNEYVASLIALTDVTAIQMHTNDVLQAYLSNNTFQASCLQCAVTRFTMFQDKLFQTTNIDIKDKILATLQILAKKFGTIEHGSVILKLLFTKTVLASIIGILRETLSRKLSDMHTRILSS